MRRHRAAASSIANGKSVHARTDSRSGAKGIVVDSERRIRRRRATEK
jgi:hypothetical protein